MRLPEYLLFGGKIEHVTEIASILMCSGMSELQVLRWFENKYGIGRFAK